MSHIVYVPMAADILHFGHIRLLEKARKLAGQEGQVIVGLHNNECIEDYKGTPPTQDYFHREEVVAAIIHVDEVMMDEGPCGILSTLANVKKSKATILLHDDAEIPKWYEDVTRNSKVTLVCVPRTLGVSSSDLKEQICRALS